MDYFGLFIIFSGLSVLFYTLKIQTHWNWALKIDKRLSNHGSFSRFINKLNNNLLFKPSPEGLSNEEIKILLIIILPVFRSPISRKKFEAMKGREQLFIAIYLLLFLIFFFLLLIILLKPKLFDVFIR